MEKTLFGGKMALIEKEYNRAAAVQYANRWAYFRNPEYYDFSAIGGDCTSFASQCILAGGAPMNYTPDFGWYYRNLNDRAPAWTGVKFLFSLFSPFAFMSAIHPVITGVAIDVPERTAYLPPG